MYKIRNKAKRDSKKILESIKELFNEMGSHLELPEPTGMHVLEREERVKMEGMKKNYKSCSEIGEAMKNVVLENFLDFDFNGKYEIASCEDCNGLLLGHMKAKCSKIGYSDEDVKKFENYLKRIGGFKEALWARDKKNREENEKIELKKEEIRGSKFAEVVRLALESKEKKTMPGATTQLVKSRQPLL